MRSRWTAKAECSPIPPRCGDWITAENVRSRGPFTIPPSPQRHPVLIQAGQSGRGQLFAAKWAELVFVFYPNLAYGKKQYKAFKAAVANAGRDPASVYVAPAVYAVVGETRAIAEEKAHLIDALALPIDSLVLLSEVFNFDLGSKRIDEPFSDAEYAAISGAQSARDRVAQLSGNPNPTVNDFVKYSGRATVREIPMFSGTAKDVADEMESWFREDTCDGFMLAATHVPGAYEDFARMVVPELQRRGSFHMDYDGNTLRENLGIGRRSQRS